MRTTPTRPASPDRPAASRDVGADAVSEVDWTYSALTAVCAGFALVVTEAHPAGRATAVALTTLAALLLALTWRRVARQGRAHASGWTVSVIAHTALAGSIALLAHT